MSSFREIEKGKYKLFVELGYDSKGKRIRKTKTVNASGPREVKKILAAFETDLYNKTHVRTEEVPFIAFIEIWKKNFGYTEIQRKTLENYENVLNSSIIPYFEKMKMHKIKTLHIVEFFKEEKEQGRRTLETKYRILASLFKHAYKWEIIDSNPMENVERPKISRKEREPYDDNEIELLLDRIQIQPIEHQLIVKLALMGGLRRAEIAGLSDEVIDFENNRITVKQSLQYSKSDGLYLKATKTENTRIVTIPDFVMEELETYYKQRLELKEKMGNLWTGFEQFMLFGNEYGKPHTPNSITRFWERFLKRTDLRKITFHDLRHSSASYSLRHGVNIKVIQKRLGHKDIKTTLNTYSHVTEEDDRSASDTFDKFGH